QAFRRGEETAARDGGRHQAVLSDDGRLRSRRRGGGAGRCGDGALPHAARHARQRAHAHAQGVPGVRLSRDRRDVELTATSLRAKRSNPGRELAPVWWTVDALASRYVV